MKAISVRAPWWWFILHAGKDIENRDWPTRFRGTIYLHASKWFVLDDVTEDAKDAVRCYHAAGSDLPTPEVTFRQMRDFGGCIVGKVDIVGCVRESNSPWFFGEYGFSLANPISFKNPIPCKGALGLFDVPREIASMIEEQS